MKKTLLILLTFCSSIAFAQHIQVDPNGNNLSLKEEHSIQNLLAEIIAKAAEHTAAEMAKIAKDFNSHVAVVNQGNPLNFSAVQNMLHQLPPTAHIASFSNLHAHVVHINNTKDPFADVVKLEAMFQAQHALFLELHMNARNGNYIIESVEVK